MTLESTGGNRARAAELLGVSLRTVRNKVREFGLPPRGDYRSGIPHREIAPRNLSSNNLANNNLANVNVKEQPCP
jgi:hypothetical protein